jgi:NADH-quinone oxidoreductase subunit M
VALLPRTRPALLKGVTVGIGLLTLVLSGIIWAGFDPAEPGFQFVERVLWIPSLGAWWHVGVDGMSLILFALTTLLTPLALLGTWDAVTEKVKGFTISLLLLEAGMLGVFVARDLFLFYVFWEAMLIPMYLLIGVCGGPPRSNSSSTRWSVPCSCWWPC